MHDGYYNGIKSGSDNEVGSNRPCEPDSDHNLRASDTYVRTSDKKVNNDIACENRKKHFKDIHNFLDIQRIFGISTRQLTDMLNTYEHTDLSKLERRDKHYKDIYKFLSIKKEFDLSIEDLANMLIAYEHLDKNKSGDNITMKNIKEKRDYIIGKKLGISESLLRKLFNEGQPDEKEHVLEDVSTEEILQTIIHHLNVAKSLLRNFRNAPTDNNITNFGWAIEQLRNGKRVMREGWNGKNMYIELQKPDQNSKMTKEYIYMKTAKDDMIPWLASQEDMLSDDWEIYNA